MNTECKVCKERANMKVNTKVCNGIDMGGRDVIGITIE
jgi:hypothetical protein